MVLTRFQIAKRDIEQYFSTLEKPILRHSDIAAALTEKKEFWRLTQGTTVNTFIKDLLRHSKLKKIELKFPSRKETRYEWESASDFQVLMSIRDDAYLSHYSAAFFHELTDQIPKIYYLNVEQKPPIRTTDQLTQASIDMAFRNKVRISNNSATFRGNQIYVLNCMGSEQLGIVTVEGPAGEAVKLSNVERTLIDIAVRPIYSGGVNEVLNAFRLARNKVSVNKLASYLKRMGYLYPYHQVLGFYLEKARNYSDAQIDVFKSMEQKYKFYLTHSMRETEYSNEWKLYFPKGM